MEFLTSLSKEQMVFFGILFLIIVYLCKKVLPYLLIAVALILALSYYLSGPEATLKLSQVGIDKLKSQELKHFISSSKDNLMEMVKKD